MKKKILFIHHHKHIGGSSKSLIQIIQILKQKYYIEMICPQGSAFDNFKKLNIKIYDFIGVPSFDNSFYGYYKNFRWLLILREIFFYITFIMQLKKIKSNYDIVHINEITAFPILKIIKKRFNCKIIIHQRVTLKTSGITIKWMNNILKKYSDKIISIDRFCFNTLNNSLKKKTKIVLNSINFKKKINVKKKNNKKIVLGFVGHTTNAKGIYELIDSLIYLTKNSKKFKLKIFSNKPQFNLLARIIHYLRIKDDFYYYFQKKKIYSIKEIVFMGFLNNLSKIYKEIDVLIFPNKTNAIGRPVFEAASFGLPSIVCINKSKSEYIKDSFSGITYYPANKINLIRAIKKISELNIKILGKNAYHFCKKNFNLKKNAIILDKIYKNL